jgi:ribonucleoside-diphosphate reductase alpha chain
MLGLVTWKKLVGGGYMTLVNQAVPRALARLGYDQPAIDAIVSYVNEHGTIEGASDLRERDWPVFDSALTRVGTDDCRRLKANCDAGCPSVFC